MGIFNSKDVNFESNKIFYFHDIAFYMKFNMIISVEVYIFPDILYEVSIYDFILTGNKVVITTLINETNRKSN